MNRIGRPMETCVFNRCFEKKVIFILLLSNYDLGHVICFSLNISLNAVCICCRWSGGRPGVWSGCGPQHSFCACVITAHKHTAPEAHYLFIFRWKLESQGDECASRKLYCCSFGNFVEYKLFYQIIIWLQLFLSKRYNGTNKVMSGLIGWSIINVMKFCEKLIIINKH